MTEYINIDTKLLNFLATEATAKDLKYFIQFCKDILDEHTPYVTLYVFTEYCKAKEQNNKNSFPTINF